MEEEGRVGVILLEQTALQPIDCLFDIGVPHHNSRIGRRSRMIVGNDGEWEGDLGDCAGSPATVAGFAGGVVEDVDVKVLLVCGKGGGQYGMLFSRICRLDWKDLVESGGWGPGRVGKGVLRFSDSQPETLPCITSPLSRPSQCNTP